MNRADVKAWVARYEQLWRTPGTGRLGEIFGDGVSYRPSPWAEPIVGLEALGRYWENERTGSDEEFAMASDVLAMDAGTAVVRVFVTYGDGSQWRDLWVLEFQADGRCSSFEEWPFAPDG